MGPNETKTKTKLDPQAYSPMSACQYAFPANSCQNTSLVTATYCKYLFTIVFSFNLWLSTFLSNVRMGSKPQKSFCELHGLCYSLKEDKVTGCTALIYITCQGLFILGQRRVSGVLAGYLWSSSQDYSVGIGKEYLWHWQNVVLVLLKKKVLEGFYLCVSGPCQINILAGNSISATSSFL